MEARRLSISLLFFLFHCCSANKLLLISEHNETAMADLFKSSLPSGVEVTKEAMVDHEADDDVTPFCDALDSDGEIAAVVDLSWGGWEAGRKAADEAGVPYVHVEASNKPFVMVSNLKIGLNVKYNAGSCKCQKRHFSSKMQSSKCFSIKMS